MAVIYQCDGCGSKFSGHLRYKITDTAETFQMDNWIFEWDACSWDCVIAIGVRKLQKEK